MEQSLWIFGRVVAVLAMSLALCAQERPLTITGDLSTGYYNATQRGDANGTVSFVPVGAHFEIGGYYMSPDLLTFWLAPDLNSGPQATDVGFQGGNGVRLRMTMFRKFIPITFHCSTLKTENISFGGGLSDVALLTSSGVTKEIGLNVSLPPSLKGPTLNIDWGLAESSAASAVPGIYQYNSGSNHVNADSSYKRWGWDLRGALQYLNQESDVLVAQVGGPTSTTLKQTTSQYNGAASRSLLGDSQFFFEGGGQSTAATLISQPLDLTTHFASTGLQLFQKRRVRTSLRATYSSNLTSQLLAQAVGSLSGAGATVTGPDALTPFSREVSTLTLNDQTDVTLIHGFGIHTSIDRTSYFSPGQSDMLSAHYLSATAGLTYLQRLSWGSVSGEYARQLGEGTFNAGQSGRIDGQTYRAAVQKGSAQGLQFDATVHGATETVHIAQQFTFQTFMAEGNVSDRLFGKFRGTAGGGWQWTSNQTPDQDLHSGGYSARAGISHPRFQWTVALNDSVTNTLPFYNNLLGGPDAALISPLALQTIPSDYRGLSLTLHVVPTPKLELAAFWSTSRQHIDGLVSNTFDILNTFASYRFRKLRFEAGYLKVKQTFEPYPTSLRTRFYLRISRQVRIL